MDVLLTREPLSMDAARRAVADPGSGAIVVFAGSVRDTEDGARIAGLDYEAYESMAAKELGKILDDVGARRGARLAVHHRLGRVPAGEISVIVAAAATHRAEAFEACREAIDRLKIDVPIWKSAAGAG